MDRIGVLFLTNTLLVGGFETHLLSLLKELDRGSFQPLIGCLKDGGPLEPEFRGAGIPVYTHIQRGPYDPVGILRLARILGRERVAIVDSDLQRNTVLVGTLAAILARVPAIVISVHATAPVGRDRLLQRTTRLCMGRIDRLIALAEVHRNLLLEQGGVDPEKVTVLWNGVDVETFHPGPPSRELREDLGIPEHVPVVAIVASLYPDKGHEVFLEAARQVLARHPEAVFLIVGDGPQRESLETRAREAKIERAVRFVGRRRDLPDLLRLVDINVLSSYPYRETFPISVLEAMASGNPTVTTRVGALSDIVAENETGFLVDVGDADSLATALVRLLDEPELRKQMGHAARRRAEDLFSIRKIVRQRETLYRQVLETKRGRRK